MIDETPVAAAAAAPGPGAALEPTPEVTEEQLLTAIIESDVAKARAEAADAKADEVSSRLAERTEMATREAEGRAAAEQRAALIRDCRVVFALNSSNWLAASAEPRCSLEAVARAVFERHTRGATYDATRSGCEWWAQARTRGSHRP